MVASTAQRLVLIGRRMTVFSTVLALALPVVLMAVLFRVFAGFGPVPGLFNNVPFVPSNVGGIERTGVFVVQLLAIAPVTLALWRLGEAFRAFSRPSPDFAVAARGVRASGYWFLWGVVAGILARTLSGVLVTLSAVSGQRMVSVGFGTPEMFGLLMAGTLLALGHVLVLAADLEAENRSFV